MEERGSFISQQRSASPVERPSKGPTKWLFSIESMVPNCSHTMLLTLIQYLSYTERKIVSIQAREGPDASQLMHRLGMQLPVIVVLLVWPWP